MAKQNDWLVASLNNPDFTVADFKNISDLSLDNTQFLNKEVYKSSPFIRNQKIFQDNDGNFSEKKFDDYYSNIASSFRNFSMEDTIDNYQYSMWDPSRPDKGKIKSINFNLSTAKNPDHNKISIEGINAVTLSDKTRKELAQNSKIFDPKTGTFLNVSVNDISFFSNPVEYVKSLFDDPLVYATYDKDTVEIDPVTGNKVVHKAGEWKVNEDGEYYTEKSNGRNLRGKQVVSAEDYITSENSALNSIDFFDSDDQDKSVAGTIAKNVAAVLPMFVPYVGTASKIGSLLKTIPTIYSGLLVGRELAKSLPMAYGMLASVTGDQNPNSKLLNTIAAYGQKFTGSTSEYAQENTFAFENFGNLMSDVALQWGQQKFIADTFNKLSKGGQTALKTAQDKAAKEYIDQANKYIQDFSENKISSAQLSSYIGLDRMGNPLQLIQSGEWTNTALGKAALNKYMPAAEKIFENRNKIGQDLSLVYMALISNTDVYDSILEHGGTAGEAAALAFGSTLGMFTVDKYLGLGDMFFQKDPARQALRKAARENAELFMQGKKAVTEELASKEGIVNKIRKGIDIGKKTVDDFLGKYKDGTVGLIGKALGEGTEEMAEELVTDFTKSLGELAGKLGYFSQTDYGAWEDMGERYAMSFLGGAAGGAMFGGVEAWNNNNKNIKDFQSDLITLIRQGKKNEVLKELTSLKEKGQLGDLNLSYDTVKNSDGTETNITADDQHISQAESNYRGLSNIIHQLDNILNGNGLKIDDDELFDKMVQGEYRAKALSDLLKGKDADTVKAASYISKYQDDFKELTEKIVAKEQEIQKLNNKVTDPQKRNDPHYQEELNKLEKEKQDLLEQKEYLFGEGSLGYVEKTLFAMDSRLSGNFVTLNFHQYVRERTGKDSKDLTPAEKESLKKDYERYSKTKKMDLDTAFNLYKQMQKHLTPEIQGINDLNLDTYYREFERIRKADPNNKLLQPSEKLPTETDEEYAALQSQQEGETPEEYKARLQAHNEAIKKYNIDNQFKWIQEFAQNPITSSDFRFFVSRLNILRHELENWYLDQVTDGKHWYDLSTNNKDLQEELKKQGADIHDLIKTIGINNETTLRDEIKNRIAQTAKNYFNSMYADDFGGEYDYISNVLQGVNALSDDEKEAIGIPAEYAFDEKVKGLSYADIYALICKEVNEEVKNGKDPQEMWDDVVDDRSDFVDKKNKAEFKALMDVLKNEESTRSSLLKTDAANRIRSLERNFKITKIKEQTKVIEDQFFKNFDKFIKYVKESDQIKALNALESATLVNNPLIPILNKISSFHAPIKIEDLLKEIYNTYTHSETDSDFQLSDTQVINLKQVLQDLDMAEAFLYGAKTIESNGTPIGHNNQINEFIKNHKDVFKNSEELVEISNDDYNTLIQQIQLYKREINQWLNKHENNSAQRDIKFIKASQALSSVIQDTFKLNRDAFKISPTLDLLDGYEDLTLDNSLSSQIAVRQLLYKNFINSGLSVQDVLKALTPSIFDPKQVINQQRAKLDENLTFDKFTQYDKFQLIVSSLIVDPIKYYKQLKKFLDVNDSIAPISIQEYVSSLTFAQQQNPSAINEALNWLKIESGSKLSIIENATIVEGLGGSGKTFAVAKLNLETGKDTLVSGPTEFQVTNLKKSLPDATEKSKQELLDYIFGGSTPNLETFFSDDHTPKAAIPTVKVTDAPKNIVIDEVTHFKATELIAISQFCKENNINLLLIGDPHQNGTETNIQDNVLISWKTPELFLSLRNANAIKFKSQTEIVGIIDRIAGNADKLGDTVYEEQFKNFKLSYYNQDTFNGDIITNNPKSIIEKISKDARIGFIGSISTELHKYLKDNGYNVSEVINPTEVQGQEFDYVIVDKDWKFKKEDDWNDTNINIKEFLQDLYTMITRSTQGTILIDKGLSRVIKSQETKFSGQYKGLDQSVKKFRDQRIPEIEKAIQDNPEIIANQGTGQGTTNQGGNQGNNQGTQGATNQGTDQSTNQGTNQGTINKIPEEELKEDEPEHIENNEQEFDEAINDEDEAKVIPSFPVSAFSSVTYGGINTSNKGEWVNDNNSTTDLGIFVKPGETLKSNDIYSTVVKLKQLKSLFQYGFDNYSSLPNDIKAKFDKNSFDNARYFIKVEAADNNNRLVGFTKGTNLTNDDRTYKGKVLKLVAKIVGKDGVEYTLSLGGLNRPDTWAKNEDALRAGVKRLIDKVQNQINNNETPTANINELQELYDNYHSTIVDYTNFIDKLVENDQEYELEYPPQFSKNCLLRKLDHFERLEYMNSTKSPYNESKPIQVESPIYILTQKDIPGLDPSLKGKAVMFISDNMLLNSADLKDIYLEQKQNNSYDNRQVRMVVLSNVGVSWKSLYDRDFKDLYNVQRGNKVLTTPMRLRSFALRMYQSMWNYRADLQRFIERVDEDLIKKYNLTDDDLDKACQLDNEEYKRLRGSKKPKEFTEADYRKACSEEVKKKVQFLWEFNDNLKDYVKEFRLGYEAEHGAYIRKLTNIEDKFYDKPEEACGIYMNIDIARKHKAIIENLFTNIVDKFIPPVKQNTKSFIDELLKTDPNKGEFKDWYKKLAATGTVHMKFIDEAGTPSTTSIDIKDQGQLASLAFTMIKTSKYMGKQLFTGLNDYNDWLVELQEQGIENPYVIERKVDDNTEKLNWASILEALKENSVPNEKVGVHSYSPGLIPYGKDENGKNIGIYDSRLDDFFNLMFHGVVSTKKENTFLENEIRATAASFKFGIFSDPVLKTTKGVNPNELEVGETGTSRKLFKCNAVVSGPYIQLRLDQKQSTKPKTENKETKPARGSMSEQEKLHNTLTEPLNKLDLYNTMNNVLSKCSSKESYIQILNSEIQSKLQDWIQGTSPINFNDVLLEVDADGNPVYLKDEFEGNITDIKSEGQSKLITFDNGKQIRVSYDNDLNKVQYKDVTAEKEAKEKAQELQEKTGVDSYTTLLAPEMNNYYNVTILEEFKKVVKDLDDDFIQDWVDTVNKFTEGTGEVFQKTENKLINRLANIILDDYMEIFLESGASEDSIEDFVKSLQAGRQNKCII